MERHTVSRLIGAPPGYVGFDQGGLLTDAVDQHPHCVLLLDEIEKAHPDLFNILLQVMDHGKLTDHNGKTVDFRNVILIMTTNAGASDMAQARRSASARRSAKARTRRRSSGCSRRNSATASMRSCRSARCRAGRPPGGRQVHPAARGAACRPQRHLRAVDGSDAWLADKGYDKLIGARPLGRLIQEKIKKPLAEEVLFGKLKKGGTVRVTVEPKDGGEMSLKLEALADEVPVRPKKEEPRKPAAKKTGPRKTAAQKPKLLPVTKDGGKRSLVPQLPRKG